MRRRFIVLGLLIFSSMICTSTALNIPAPKPEYKSYQGLSNLSYPVLQEEPENQGFARRVQYHMGKHVMKLEWTEKKPRGKGTGVYGGGNMARRPRPNKNAAKPLTPTATAPFLILTMILTSLRVK